MRPHLSQNQTDTRADTGDFLRQNTKLHPNIISATVSQTFPGPIHILQCSCGVEPLFRGGGRLRPNAISGEAPSATSVFRQKAAGKERSR
jgi:hypothetical protein